MPDTESGSWSRWWEPAQGIAATHQNDRQDYGAHPGFINTAFHAVLALCVLASLHHILQSVAPKKRFLFGDIYVAAWLVLVVAGTSCALSGWSAVCFAPGRFLTAIAAYRLTEILSRELWIILYPGKPLTSFSRVLSVSIVNYATATGLFGYLYGTGDLGFRQAATISLTFAPFEPPLGALQIVQGTYCVAFLIVIVTAFVARAALPATKR